MYQILFVCSRNQWRSPTAESIYRNRHGWSVRSAGTSHKARRKITEADLEWADIVFVMETQHKRQLRSRFGSLMDDVELVNLDIPDEYQYMDPELVELLEDGVEGYLNRLRAG